MGSLAEHKRAVHEGFKYPCGQCSYQSTTKGSLAEHERSVHEGVKYPCRKCGHQSTTKGNLAEHKRSFHEGQCGHRSTTKGNLAMSESNILANIVANSLPQRDHWLATKDLFMKESRPCWSFLAI